jgi:hypothetical protein
MSFLSDDENDEEVDRIIQDTSNRAKIEFALKLGYTESQIADVRFLSTVKSFGTTHTVMWFVNKIVQINAACFSTSDFLSHFLNETLCYTDIFPISKNTNFI